MQKSYKCLSPVQLPGMDEPIGRCGRCKPCIAMKRLHWGNRMCLENFGLSYRPLFVTTTYDHSHLPSNSTECLKYVQLWIKRLRKRLNYKIRYFMVTENGTKNGRLHQHLIMWIPSIMHLSYENRWRILHETWKGGRLECKEVTDIKFFYYCTKYIIKNLSSTESDGYVWCRYDGAWVKPGKLYTWSNNPRLGDAGITRWETITEKRYKQSGHIPPNWLNMPLFGSLQKVYIPTNIYLKHVKSLGIILRPADNSDVPYLDPIKENEIQKTLYKKTFVSKNKIL